MEGKLGIVLDNATDLEFRGCQYCSQASIASPERSVGTMAVFLGGDVYVRMSPHGVVLCGGKSN